MTFFNKQSAEDIKHYSIHLNKHKCLRQLFRREKERFDDKKKKDFFLNKTMSLNPNGVSRPIQLQILIDFLSIRFRRDTRAVGKLFTFELALKQKQKTIQARN